MPAGKYRSHTFKKIFVRTPGSRTAIHYRKRKPGKARCGNCHKVLAGVPYVLPCRMRTMPKTRKRPERPYGGVLCAACSRLLFKGKARQQK